jgi:hypothetical protein
MPVLAEAARERVAVTGAPRGQVIFLSLESLNRRTGLIVHELTHQFAFDMLPRTSRQVPQLIEGLAEHMRGRWSADDLRTIRDAAATGDVPSVVAADMNSRAWGHALFDFIRADYGEEGVRRLVFGLRTLATVSDAVPVALETTNEQFDRAFLDYVTATFGRP